MEGGFKGKSPTRKGSAIGEVPPESWLLLGARSPVEYRMAKAAIRDGDS